MFKTILPFYIICFALYVFFSRQPDYLDGEFTTGNIHYIKDSTQNSVAKVFFTVDKTSYNTNASYALRRFKENENVKVIYDTSNPKNAAVFSWWGYWLKWDELLASVFFTVLLYFGANAITSNPAPETLIEELENKERGKRRKYD